MSDDEIPYGPLPASDWLRDHRKRLMQEAEAAYVAKAQASLSEICAEYQHVADEAIKAFSALPCRGELAKVGECSEDFAAQCGQATKPSCPREIQAFDRRQAAQLNQERMERSGLPQDARDVIAEGVRPTEATSAVDAFLAAPEMRLLILSSLAGRGKSIAAAYAIFRQAGRFVTAADLGRMGFDEKERLQGLYQARLLVLDDLGREYAGGKGWLQSAIEDLLTTRYDGKRRTIVTTNLSAQTFKERYGERVADRIRGRGRFVVLGGPSLRGRE